MLKRSQPVRFALFALATSLLAAGQTQIHQPTFFTQNSQTQQTLISVSPVNSQIVWAAGTGGTWLVTTDGHVLFVTNRHNVDPKLKHGMGTSFTLASVELQVRGGLDGKVAFHPVTQLSSTVWCAPSADCALIRWYRNNYCRSVSIERGCSYGRVSLAE